MNVALAVQGAIATASSTYNNCTTPNMAINNERTGANWGACSGTGGGWNDGTVNAYPDWIQIDFNGAKTIDQVVVYTVQDNINNPVEPTDTMTFTKYGVDTFNVQGWDGSAWVNLGNAYWNKLVKRTISFSAYTTTKIRILINVGSPDGYSRITEIEAWSPIGATPVPKTYQIKTDGYANFKFVDYISCTPNPVTSGADTSCIISPPAGWDLFNLGDDTGSMVDVTSQVSYHTYLLHNVTTAHHLSALYSPIASASGTAGGAITPTQQVVDYSTGKASFSLSANSGYQIGTVSGCGGTLTGGIYTTGVVSAPCTVSATFTATAPSTYQVTTSAGTGGSISPASAAVNSGATKAFTVTANSGYSIGSVTGCGGSLNGTTFTTGAVTGACTVSATFTATAPSADTQAPTVPTTLSATASSSSQVNLSWAASTDNVGVTAYKVYRGGWQIASQATTSYSDTGQNASTSYSYTVSACDAAGNCSAQSTAASATTLAATDTNYQDLWWNANESGWGMSITQHNSMVFAALYTYDQAGLPTWYVMSSCPVSVNSCTGNIYKVSGGTSPAVPWDGAGKAVNSAGTGTLTFTDANNGTFDYILNGIHSSKSITRQIFASGITPPAVNYSDLWWNQNESGWGVALTQQYAMIFAAWYTYDASGKAIWYVVSSCPVSGSGCTGDVYQVTGGSPLTSAWNGSSKVVTKAGSVTFAFTDANNGSMNYSINGATGNRVITRQGF